MQAVQLFKALNNRIKVLTLMYWIRDSTLVLVQQGLPRQPVLTHHVQTRIVQPHPKRGDSVICQGASSMQSLCQSIWLLPLLLWQQQPTKHAV